MNEYYDDDEEENQYFKYRVWLKSAPGFYAQYDGKVDVYARSLQEARNLALAQLKNGAFKDRNNSMWKIIKIEIIEE